MEHELDRREDPVDTPPELPEALRGQGGSLDSDHKNRSAEAGDDAPSVDNDDPNLSALFAETGAEERLDEVGLQDENSQGVDNGEG